MKKNIFLLTMLLCMVSATTFAHDIEVVNDDGVTIYYVWTNNKTELAVSYRGSNFSYYSDEYSGNVVIPSSVTYNGSTYTITAYAKAEGYRDSDMATATIGWKNGRPVIIRGFSNVDLEEDEPICDVNNDGTVDVADIVTIISAMASKSREGRTE